MAEVAITDVEVEIDQKVVTQEEHYEQYEDDHPKVLDPEDDTKAGDEYLALPEQKGVVTLVAKAKVEGFEEGQKLQLDIFTADGWRTAEIVEVKTDADEFEWTVGPIPLSHFGTYHISVFKVNKRGNVYGEAIARYDSA